MDIIGESRALKAVREQVANVDPEPVSVLITGETGTGKELTAKALHIFSKRSGKLVIVNCASLSDELGEKALFGWVKGAFTGATTDGEGLLHLAANGTLFLDEIAELSPRMQAKLLRVQEEKSFRRVGSLVDEPCNIRFISATHQVLDADHFRPDLLQRLAEYTIHLPPIRERGRDVILLATRIVRRIPSIRFSSTGGIGLRVAELAVKR